MQIQVLHIRMYMEEGENYHFEKAFFLDDSGYACSTFLLTPECERAFGSLKRGLPVLCSGVNECTEYVDFLTILIENNNCTQKMLHVNNVNTFYKSG